MKSKKVLDIHKVVLIIVLATGYWLLAVARWCEFIYLKTLGKINKTSTQYIPSSHTSPLRSVHYSTDKGFLHIKIQGAYNGKHSSIHPCWC